MGRIGICRDEDDGINGEIYHRNVGKREYEVTDQVGSVRGLISDIKLPPGEGQDGFQPDVLMLADYDNYGMLRPNRTYSLLNHTYEYGFQGMRRMVQGDRSSLYTTLFRTYDAATGAWTSHDPIFHAGASPYNGLNGNPTSIIDPLGLDGTSTDELSTPLEPAPTKSKSETARFNSAYDRSLMEVSTRHLTQKDLADISDPNGGTYGPGVRLNDHTMYRSKYVEETGSYTIELGISYQKDDKSWGWEWAEWPYTYSDEPIYKVEELVRVLVHTTLDVAGMIPVIGELADGTNALIYISEGDYQNAALSAAAMVPVYGMLATGAKVAAKIARPVVKVAKNGTKLLMQFSSSTIEAAVQLVMKDANKLHHLFPAKHNLGPLVTKLGGQENTVRAVLNAANGKLPSSGVFNDIPVEVDGSVVFIRGAVVDGIPRLGTMFIP